MGKCIDEYVPDRAEFAKEFKELFRSDVVGQVLYEESSVDFCTFQGRLARVG